MNLLSPPAWGLGAQCRTLTSQLENVPAVLSIKIPAAFWRELLINSSTAETGPF